VLAVSSHGRVYTASGTDGSRVVLKELAFATVPSAERIQTLEREAQALQSIDDVSSVPRFVESFREGQGTGLRLYLAQELIEGTSLENELREHRYGEDEIRSIAREVLTTLSSLHGRGILHRDIKPANIIRRADGRLVLVDFGASRLPQASRGSTVAGTFGFMAPEALWGAADERSDLYALGATLTALLTRRHPAEMLGGDMGLRLEDNLSVSEALQHFLRRLVARDPESRFESAAQALAEMDGTSRQTVAHKRNLAPVFAGIALLLCVVSGWYVSKKVNLQKVLQKINVQKLNLHPLAVFQHHFKYPIEGQVPALKSRWTRGHTIPGELTAAPVRIVFRDSSGQCHAMTSLRVSQFLRRERSESAPPFLSFVAVAGNEVEKCEGAEILNLFRAFDDTGREWPASVQGGVDPPIAGSPIGFSPHFSFGPDARRVRVTAGSPPQLQFVVDLRADTVEELK
jgi:hypothetical protein